MKRWQKTNVDIDSVSERIEYILNIYYNILYYFIFLIKTAVEQDGACHKVGDEVQAVL